MISIFQETGPRIEHGAHTIPDGQANQLTTRDLPAGHGVVVRAAKTNAADIYVGTCRVTADTAETTAGMFICPGEYFTMPIDNANKVFVRGTANDVLHWMTT